MTIGELAREAAVSTRTLRFWADEGLVPCGRTASGYRSFGPEALPVAGLIRVLRELDVDLATIRSILEGRRDLATVVATHVDVIDARIAQLRFQRSVLRALATVRRTTSQELQIMYDLANLTADQRRRLITDLVDEAFAGLDDPGPVAERMRMATPDLPDDPSPEQVAAWVELARLVEDPSFRARVREMAVAGGPAGEGQAAFGAAVAEHAAAALAAGVDPASTEAAKVVDRVLASWRRSPTAPPSPTSSTASPTPGSSATGRCWARSTAGRPGHRRCRSTSGSSPPAGVDPPGGVAADHAGDPPGVVGRHGLVRHPAVQHAPEAVAELGGSDQVELRQAVAVGREQHLGERCQLQALPEEGAGPGAHLPDGETDVEVDVRVHGRQPPGLAVVRVAVEQDHRHPGGFEGGQQRLEEGRVGTAEGQVAVPEAGVDLEREAEVDTGPDDEAEQHGMVEARPPARQPLPGRLPDLGGGRPCRVQVEAVPVGHDRLDRHRVAGGHHQGSTYDRRELRRADVELLGDPLEPDDLRRGRACRPPRPARSAWPMPVSTSRWDSRAARSSRTVTSASPRAARRAR